MFKKSLSVILALLMVVSCMSTMIFTASAETYAPEGEAITSAADFAAMTADGKYYLAADITIDTTYAKFTGTLDGKDTEGNVHTITTSVPIFHELDGTVVKNLNISGNVEFTGVNGVLANETPASTSNKIVVSNVTNNATIAITGGSYPYVGGFIGQAQQAVEFTDCVYNGSITAEYSGSTQSPCGGFIGRVGNNQTPGIATKFLRCTNSGNITMKIGGNTLVGGFVGWYFLNNDCTFESCTNTGKITTKDSTGGTSKVGGFIGLSNPGSAKNYSHTYIGCTNDGDIEAYNYAGGFEGDNEGNAVIFKGCVNNGDITMGRTAGTFVGGFVADNDVRNAAANGLLSFFENCTNTGVLTSTSTSNTNLLGGLVGNFVPNKTEFRNCVNKGNISCATVGTGNKIGGIAASWGGGSSVTVTAVGCVNYGDLASTRLAGGIVGDTNATGKYIACVNRGTVTGTHAQEGWFGGITGSAGALTAYSCVNYGSVTSGAGAYAAGLLGNCTEATLTNCENFGAVSGDEGKVFGISQVGTQINCYDRTEGEYDGTTVSLDFEGVQRSIAVDNEETFSLRFISRITDINKYKSTGVLVYVTESEKSGTKYVDDNTTTVYTQISCVENGVSKAYPETVTAGTYFSALTVINIPVTGTYSFIIVPYTVDLNGDYAYADAYTVAVNDGVVANPVALAPVASN